MKQAFAPDDAQWAAQVLARFDEVVGRLGHALACEPSQ